MGKRFNALTFDAGIFVIGGSYKITSEYFNVDQATCMSATSRKLEFTIPSTHHKRDFDVITLTPEQVGSGGYVFEHLPHVPIYQFRKVTKSHMAFDNWCDDGFGDVTK